MTASRHSSAGELDAALPAISHEVHELLSQVLPLLIVDAQKRIAEEARRAAWHQVDHTLDVMRGTLAEQTNGWLDQVSSMFGEELDRALASLGVEWRQQIERTLDPIRAVTYSHVDQAVRSTWADSTMRRAVDGRRRAVHEAGAHGAELAASESGRKRKATRPAQPTRPARRSSSSTSTVDAATASKNGAQETRLSKGGAAKRSKAQSGQPTVAERSAKHPSKRQTATRSASDTSAARTPARSTDARREGPRKDTSRRSRKEA